MSEFNIDNIMERAQSPLLKSPSYKMIALRVPVVFPGQTSHFDLSRDKSLLAVERANAEKEPIFLAAQRSSAQSNPQPKDIYTVGVLAKIQQIIKLPNDTARILVTATDRMRIEEYVSSAPYFEVLLTPFPLLEEESTELTAVRRAIKDQLVVYGKLEHKVPKENLAGLHSDDAEKFVAAAAQYLFDKDDARQALLEKESQYQQFETIYARLVNVCEIMAVEKKIALKVRESVDKNQKEYYLREQIKAIHDELGEGEEERETLLKRAEEKKLPAYAMEKLTKELNRMDKMSQTSPEAGVIRTYLEWMLDLPWNEMSEENPDLTRAQEILDEDHYGLDKVKERIVEYLAVHRLNGSLKAPILCFVGPPGVGKTSVVTSIARAAGRKLVQMSLGGVRDEAEIRGHRRTYVGALPGRILSGMKTVGVANPVFLLDEIDKMSSDFRGDPASAMLEVLDPNQNNQFKDHYLEIPYDLSKTMFVATANTLDSIPAPLLDRMEIIELSGYTYDEKLQIAKRYLLPKQLAANGMSAENVAVGDDVMMDIISLYTRESGVRNLEREIAAVIRKLAVKVVVANDKTLAFDVQRSDLKDYLGVPRFKADKKAAKDHTGRVTGLAWTRVGGVTLNIEAVLIEGGKGDITLTGNMGDVMKESARTALSLVRSRADKYGIDRDKFSKYDIHIHIPEGATPKDGPSAGITLATALLSALSGLKVRGNVAMTGEITLLGDVLAIGGLKEKSLAAFRSGVKTLIIPAENEKDIADLPAEVTEHIRLVSADTIDTVFDTAIVKKSKKTAQGGV
ncbi:MAG: endopeptidase La [Clostridiales bacterium]|jgi:ATP-dependent Lon protease|nr:endopeptidase La [Clostridiales bacterium]